MAAYHVSSRKSNEISADLRLDTFALKWPEESNKCARKFPTPTIINLSVDPKCFYLICLDKTSKKIECFDITLIHDTRTGSLPQGADECDELKVGIPDVPLKSKCLTICYGKTFVPDSDLRLIHFFFRSPHDAQEWAKELFRYGHNPLLRNLSGLECLEKFHSKIINGLIDIDRKTISIQSLIQFLCKDNRELEKRTKHILQALEKSDLPDRSDSVIHADQFTFNKFFRFYMELMERAEVGKLFFDFTGGKHRRYLSWENMKEFIKSQNDSRVDSFGTDYYDKKAKDLVKKYTQHDEQLENKGMCDESFLRYLLSFDNLIIDPTKLNLYMDMDKPLSHYFIASSHNTYLRGSQIAGRSCVEMYRQVLLTGCRCIELDVLDAEKRGAEPEISHKNTIVKPILFIDVIVTIRDYAFKVSPYPLILSLENHCSAAAQAKMARYLVDVFGDSLIMEPLKTHPCQEDHPLPSPNDLKYKILIKNKKLDPKLKIKTPNVQTTPRKASSVSLCSIGRTDISTVLSSPVELCSTNSLGDDIPISDIIQTSATMRSPSDPSNIDACLEAKATKAMSDLVHYIVPIRFETFALAKERNRSYEMSSFTESTALSLIRESGKEFLSYNQRQISRIYPHGLRIESSNFNPYLFWPAGCQMVALNYQTLDAYMQLNLGLFSFNGNCGYIEKPSALCQSRESFDPKLQTNVENVAGYQIEIQLLSGQFLCQSHEPTYVDIQMYGMYADATRAHEYRIRSKRWNGFQAIYNDRHNDSKDFIRFSKIILPEMAALRFLVTSEDGTFIGQSFLPIAHLHSGYRHIVLRNKINIPVQSSTLFVLIRRNIYLSAEDQEFANRLVNPLSVPRSHLCNEKDQYQVLCSNISVRFHDPLRCDPEESCRERSLSKTLDGSCEYQIHLIAGSYLHDKKTLCKVFSLNDYQQRKDFKRDQEEIQDKLRRVSNDYQKRIQDEEASVKNRSQRRCSITSNTQQNDRSTTDSTNKKDIEQAERRLLDLYSKKFHKQEELEFRRWNEYYTNLEKHIRNDYDKQIAEIDRILAAEKSRVDRSVQTQIKADKDHIKKTETNRDRIVYLNEKSFQTHTKIRYSTIEILVKMHEELKEIIEKNLQITLNQLEEDKRIKTENCIAKYSNRFNQLKLRLQGDMHSNEFDTSDEYFPVLYRSRTASTSLSAVS